MCDRRRVSTTRGADVHAESHGGAVPPSDRDSPRKESRPLSAERVVTEATGASTRLAPLASVVLVVRNGERHIAAALESVVDQDYAPREVVVIDGQSDDRTVEIARTF